MVYVIDGHAYPGHRPREGDAYDREPTRFAHAGGALNLGEGVNLHLYVCAACPWAHRTLITRNLSALLRRHVTVSVVSPFRNDDIGWEFLKADGSNREQVQRFTGLPVTRDQSPLGADALLDIYLQACPSYTGNITTPVLYDAGQNCIISNDSFGILRAFTVTAAQEIGHLHGAGNEALAEAIDREGRQIDAQLCNGVYMCGLAKSQAAYEAAHIRVFHELERLEKRLGEAPRLVGDSTTLADIQALACLMRFDPVYFDLFKCQKRRIASYPNLSAFARSLVEEIGHDALSLDLDQIVNHYYTNFTSANPNGVVPIGYRNDFLDGGRAKYVDDAGGDRNDGETADRGGATEQDQTSATERRAQGEFVRGIAAHRNWLGDENFPVESGRYVLFVANNCPWCHRAMMARAMFQGVEELVDVSVLFYRRGGPEGRWRFLPDDQTELKDFENARPELLEGIDREDPTGNGFEYASDIYQFSDPDSVEKSVPILFDRKSGRVVSNESADIVRMFSTVSRSSEGGPDESLLRRIDAINARIYQDVNNGAYRAGFSSNQAAHEEAAAKYFKAFDWLDKILADSKYLLTSDKPTEADLRLFPTIYRHDPVYHTRMKLNVAMVRDYPHLNRWLTEMKQHPAVQRASRIDHCLAGYFGRTGNELVPFAALEHDGEREY